MDKDKISIGHKKVKELDGGIYENLALLRKALNKIVLDAEIETPEELNTLNSVFNK